MTNVVDELKLNIKYFIVESPYNEEQYPNFPISVRFGEDDDVEDFHLKKINNIYTLRRFFSNTFIFYSKLLVWYM